VEPTDEVAEAVASAMEEWLPDRLKASNVPGAAAVVVGKDRVIWEQVYGVRGAPRSLPVTPDTVFCIRSISKSVTALAVLTAVQEGLLGLDTPISEYLPEFSIQSRFDTQPESLITLRHMLSHWAAFTHDPPPGIDLPRPGYFERYISRISETWLRFPVGYRHQYSNYGFDLAGYLLQIRSGMSFDAYLRREVLEPLGMTRSTFNLEGAAQIENRAIGHDTKGNVVPLRFPEIPSAGLYSSIRDMTRYVQFHLNGGIVNGRRLLRKDLMQQYQAIQFACQGQRTGYSLGLIREVVSNTYSLYHEGGGHGFGSHMIVYPELGFGTMILTNREYHGLTGERVRTIMNAPIMNRYGPAPATAEGTRTMRKLDLIDSRLKAILGRYGDSPGIVVGFEKGVFGMRTSKDQFLPLDVFDDGGQLVGLYGTNKEVRFLSPYGNRPGAMMRADRILGNYNSQYRDFNDSPLDPTGPNKPGWQKYVGDYEVLWAGEPFAKANVSIRNGYLYYHDGKCEEYEPGLFFRYDGEALDFRANPPNYANLELKKRNP
jgi:CubicO group peptidase (beta-lactamase class C family)